MNSHSFDNTLQLSDSIAMNKNLADDIRFQYRRVRSQDLPVSSAPAVTVQSAFTTGGNNAGTTEDHQDDYELQDYFAQALGAHSLTMVRGCAHTAMRTTPTAGKQRVRFCPHHRCQWHGCTRRSRITRRARRSNIR